LEDVKLRNFTDFFFTNYEGEIEEIITQLKQAGIKTDKSQEKVLQFLKHKKAELHLEKVSKFREDYKTLRLKEKDAKRKIGGWR